MEPRAPRKSRTSGSVQLLGPAQARRGGAARGPLGWESRSSTSLLRLSHPGLGLPVHPRRTRPLAAAGDADGTSCRPRPSLRHPRLPRARLPSPQPRPPAAGATAATKAAPRASLRRRLRLRPARVPQTPRWRKYLMMRHLESKKKSKNQILPMKKNAN